MPTLGVVSKGRVSACLFVGLVVLMLRAVGGEAAMQGRAGVRQGSSQSSPSQPSPSDMPGRCVRDVVVVPDGVASAKANPLGNGTVLLLRLGELLLRAESLVALFRGGG